MTVPDILLSGDHGKIAAWRREQSLRRTQARRPDLIQGADEGGHGGRQVKKTSGQGNVPRRARCVRGVVS
jgi:tRNA G37 N-methylase TrmD